MNRLLPFEAIAAFRFMRSGLMQTLLIIVGVAVGVAVIVFMAARSRFARPNSRCA